MRKHVNSSGLFSNARDFMLQVSYRLYSVTEVCVSLFTCSSHIPSDTNGEKTFMGVPVFFVVVYKFDWMTSLYFMEQSVCSSFAILIYLLQAAQLEAERQRQREWEERRKEELLNQKGLEEDIVKGLKLRLDKLKGELTETVGAAFLNPFFNFDSLNNKCMFLLLLHPNFLYRSL